MPKCDDHGDDDDGDDDYDDYDDDYDDVDDDDDDDDDDEGESYSSSFEGVRVPLIPEDPSRECIAVLLPKPRRGGTRSLGRQERT